MYISSLALQNFRNYTGNFFSFEEKGAVFIGENGAGKTNILEAIYLLSIGRSHRRATKGEMIHYNAQEAFCEGVFVEKEPYTPLTVSIGFSRDRKLILKRNKQRVSTLSELVFNNTVIVLGSQDIVLVYGDPSLRRRYIDSILCQIDSTYLEHCLLFKKNLSQRNILLRGGSIDKTIDIYEEKMAEYGASIVISRQLFFKEIGVSLSHIFNEISLHSGEVSIQYKPSLSIKEDSNSKEEIQKVYLSILHNKRGMDRERGFTSVGPHRDDFICYFNTRPLQSFCSQGQCRALVLSFQLCALGYLEKNKPGKGIVLIDDAFAELDTKRRANICSLVKGHGQLFITAFTEHDSVIDNLPVFIVKNNTIIRQ